MFINLYESAENYLETILILKNRLGSVRSVDIANELDFARPSVSVAMKKLRESGLAIAESVYERHTHFVNWLIALGVNRETAVQDACRIEHVISQETFEKIREHTRRQMR